MAKEVIFSKIGMNNYNNELEAILEKKDFSENTKNLLLSMLYKIETFYPDYKQVKRDVIPKKELIEEILNSIEYQCHTIQFVDPSKEKWQKQEFEVNKQTGEIQVIQNERAMLEAILKMTQEEIKIQPTYGLLQKAMEEFLEIGFRTNHTEVIRDFSGWSWDITVKQIEDVTYHVLYQNLVMLLGNNFMEDWVNKNRDPQMVLQKEEEKIKPVNTILGNKQLEITDHTDQIANMKEIMIYMYGEKNANLFLEKLFQMVIKRHENRDQQYKQEVKKIQTQLEEQLALMKNKKTYLETKTQEKREKNKRIGEIDELLNNSEKLKQEYREVNRLLPNKEKIFSVSHYADRLEKERKKALLQIQEINQSLEPNKFIQIQTELENKVQFLQEIEQQEERKIEEQLQQAFLKCFQIKVEKSEEKKEIVEAIYELRYYLALPIGNEETIRSLSCLAKIVKQVKEKIIQKACENKIMVTISEDTSFNFSILKNVFDTKMIHLEEMNLLLRYEKAIVQVEIYDGSIHEMTVEHKIKEKTELTVKLKKKIKVFN